MAACPGIFELVDPSGRADSGGKPLIDTSVAHSARVHDYWLGGKDNISQVVSQSPYSDRTAMIQARHASYSNIAPFAVR
jgi:hypothetical protein